MPVIIQVLLFLKDKIVFESLCLNLVFPSALVSKLAFSAKLVGFDVLSVHYIDLIYFRFSLEVSVTNLSLVYVFGTSSPLSPPVLHML